MTWATRKIIIFFSPGSGYDKMWIRCFSSLSSAPLRKRLARQTTHRKQDASRHVRRAKHVNPKVRRIPPSCPCANSLLDREWLFSFKILFTLHSSTCVPLVSFVRRCFSTQSKNESNPRYVTSCSVSPGVVGRNDYLKGTKINSTR